MIAGPDIATHDSQGLVKPLPSFKWCVLSLASFGSPPKTDVGEMVAAYSDAAVPELDILCEVEKDLRGGVDFLGRQKKRRRNALIRTANEGCREVQRKDQRRGNCVDFEGLKKSTGEAEGA